MMLQELIVSHLKTVEDETGRGEDREALVDWYLEEKEGEMQDVEDIERETELMTKMLKKLVKVGFPVLFLSLSKRLMVYWDRRIF